MALTPWNREFGSTQGRIQPQQIIAPEGDFVFVLGRDLPGLKQQLEIGDFAEVKQTADFGPSTNFVRFCATLRPPAEIPSGAAWKASLFVAGVEVVSRLIEVSRTRKLIDLGWNVSKLVGDNELKFRLELVVG